MPEKGNILHVRPIECQRKGIFSLLGIVGAGAADGGALELDDVPRDHLNVH
jgi:hypothetical protein